MIYVFPSNDGASIVYDETTLTEEYKLKGIPLEQLPDIVPQEGKKPILKANKETGEVWWEYIDIVTPREKELEQRIAELEQIIDTMLNGGME